MSPYDLTGLPQLTIRLLAATSAEQVVDVVADLGRPVLGADLVGVVLREPAGPVAPTGLSCSSSTAVRGEWAKHPVDTSQPVRDVLRTGEPVLLRDRAEQHRRYPELERSLLGTNAVAALPLRGVGGRGVGALVLGWSTPQPFPATDVELLTSVARCCGAALATADRHRALTTEQDTAQHASLLLELQTLSGDLARATQVSEVADVVVSIAAKSLGATAASLVSYDEHTDVCTLLAASGLPAEGVARWSTFPASTSPLAVDQIRTRHPVLITSFTDRVARYPEMADNQVPQEAWANLPLIVGGQVVGIAAFGWDEPRQFSTSEVEHLTALASHTAIALDRAHLLAAASATAETLQRALLPQASPVPGWEVGSVYAPAIRGTHVGGDWYDVFELPGGLIGLALGDVVGKGVRAAAIMGSARSALRAFASTDPDPSVVLTDLDVFLDRFAEDTMVTCCYAVLDPATGELRYCSAGHPPPVLATQHGWQWLDEATSPPLGAGSQVPRRSARLRLLDDAPAPEQTAHGRQTCHRMHPVLVLYSDGLVERWTTPITAGMTDLARAARDLISAADLERGLHRMVATLQHPDGLEDDRAVLAIRPQQPTRDGQARSKPE
ncbi:MAG: GAF domain-containing SpoIIE family protein phosphatase [Angustibacter sp.]